MPVNLKTKMLLHKKEGILIICAITLLENHKAVYVYEQNRQACIGMTRPCYENIGLSSSLSFGNSKNNKVLPLDVFKDFESESFIALLKAGTALIVKIDRELLKQNE